MAATKVQAQPPRAKSSLRVELSSGFAVFDKAAVNCPYDASLTNDNCYFLKTAARIDKIHTHLGSHNGGQLLRIWGHFAPDMASTTITINGISCVPRMVKSRLIECVTEAGPATPEIENGYSGNPGWTTKKHDNSQWVNIDNLHNVPVTHTYTSTQLEIPSKVDNYYGISSEGWFHAPVDGEYTFFVACDNQCKVYFSMDENTNVGKADTDVNMVEIISVGWTPQRNYWYKGDGSQQSVAITLTGGQKYLMNYRFKEDTGDDYMSIGLEINPTSFVPYNNHRQLNKEVQDFDVQREGMMLEQWSFRVTKENCGGYWIFFQTESGHSVASDNEISGSASADEFRFAIDGYYNSYVHSPIEVEKVTIYDINEGDPNADPPIEAVTTFIAYEYRVTVVKQIAAPSFVTLTTLNVDPMCSFEPAEITQTSTPPLTGFFKLSDGTFQTNELNLATVECTEILENLYTANLEWQDKMDCWKPDTNKYRENRFNFRLRWTSFNGEVPQLQMIDAELPANQIDADVNKAITTISDYSPNRLFYPVVPFEFLTQVSNQPQVIVNNNGAPAVCPNNNCHFKYVASDSKATKITPTYASDLHVAAWVQVDGLTLPYTQTTFSVEFGGVACDVSNANGESIVCYLQSNPMCGSHGPKVHTDTGILDYTGNLVDIPLTINGISPSEIAKGGDTQITFSGKGFPTAGSSLSNLITFSDGTGCTNYEFADDGTWMRCTTGQPAASSAG